MHTELDRDAALSIMRLSIERMVVLEKKLNSSYCHDWQQLMKELINVANRLLLVSRMLDVDWTSLEWYEEEV